METRSDYPKSCDHCAAKLPISSRKRRPLWAQLLLFSGGLFGFLGYFATSMFFISHDGGKGPGGFLEMREIAMAVGFVCLSVPIFFALKSNMITTITCKKCKQTVTFLMERKRRKAG